MITESVAIMFTDVVGSTELSQHLSAEVADKVRRSHFSIFRRAISESGGIEVMSQGDGVMVLFATASAAMTCAVALQQAIELDNRPTALVAPPPRAFLHRAPWRSSAYMELGEI